MPSATSAAVVTMCFTFPSLGFASVGRTHRAPLGGTGSQRPCRAARGAPRGAYAGAGRDAAFRARSRAFRDRHERSRPERGAPGGFVVVDGARYRMSRMPVPASGGRQRRGVGPVVDVDRDLGVPGEVLLVGHDAERHGGEAAGTVRLLGVLEHRDQRVDRARVTDEAERRRDGRLGGEAGGLVQHGDQLVDDVLVAQQAQADGGGLEQVGLVLRLLDDLVDALDGGAIVHQTQADGDVAAGLGLGDLLQLGVQHVLGLDVADDADGDRVGAHLARGLRVRQGGAKGLAHLGGTGLLVVVEGALHDAQGQGGPGADGGAALGELVEEEGARVLVALLGLDARDGAALAGARTTGHLGPGRSGRSCGSACRTARRGRPSGRRGSRRRSCPRRSHRSDRGRGCSSAGSPSRPSSDG